MKIHGVHIIQLVSWHILHDVLLGDTTEKAASAWPVLSKASWGHPASMIHHSVMVVPCSCALNTTPVILICSTGRCASVKCCAGTICKFLCQCFEFLLL